MSLAARAQEFQAATQAVIWQGLGAVNLLANF
jgi:hypothetical protein